MELELLGTGTSHGIPVISCTCDVCASVDSRDKRLRASALIRLDNGMTILIDSGPEFRIQALRAGLSRLDTVLFTHSHADHTHGLDDVRIFTHTRDMPIYAEQRCAQEIRERFAYIFHRTQEGGGKPHIKLISIEAESAAQGEANAYYPPPIDIGGMQIIPIPAMHGSIPVLGWRIGDTAYLTDCSAIPEASLDRLKGLTNLVIGALRERPHSTHFSFSQAVSVIHRIGPQHAWFTHICHDFSHQGIINWLDTNHPGKKIEPAYDGLRITIR